MQKSALLSLLQTEGMQKGKKAEIYCVSLSLINERNKLMRNRNLKNQFGKLSMFLLLAAAANAQNLATNGGFETGDLTGWNHISAALVFCNNFRFSAHSGNCAVSLSNSHFEVLSQTIATTPGQSYDFDFWLQQTAGESAPENLTVTWNGVTVLSIPSQVGPMSYTHKVFTNLVATGTTTTISFSGNGDTLERWVIDDVNVAKSLTLFERTLNDISAASSSDGINNQGIANSLTEKINNANNAPDKTTRDNIINAFIHEVSAQAGKHITTAAAALLIGDAIALLGLP